MIFLICSLKHRQVSSKLTLVGLLLGKATADIIDGMVFNRVTFELGDVLVEILGGFSVQGVRGGRMLGREAIFFVFVHISGASDWDIVKALDDILGGLSARGVARGVIFGFEFGVVALDFVDVVPALGLDGLAALVSVHDARLGRGHRTHHLVFRLNHFDEDVCHYLRGLSEKGRKGSYSLNLNIFYIMQMQIYNLNFAIFSRYCACYCIILYFKFKI